MSDDISRSPNTPEPLPPELLGIEHQVLADGAVWERSVPPADSFTRRIRSVLQEESMRDSEKPTERLAREMKPGDAGAPSPRAYRMLSRWRAFAATVAAVLIVGLLGAVFAALAHNHGQAGNGPHRQPQVTATVSTPTPAHIHVLSEQPAATNQPGTPIVAQSDPQVMYEYADNGSGAVLRHSVDGGTTWSDIAFPVSTVSLGAVYLAVSPLDAQNVFLGVDVPIPATASCDVHADIHTSFAPKGNAKLCPQLYRSQDGGTIWQLVQLPTSGTIFPTGVVFFYDSTILQGQGNRLYAKVFYNQSFITPSLDIRILSTTDEGATWQAADTSLTKLAPHVCEYAATPVGSTLFAVSAASCISEGDGTLWRSDDAGATWIQVVTIANWALNLSPALVAANVNGDPTRPLLYTEQMSSQLLSASDVAVSADGGKTWRNAPLAGVPAKAQLLMMGSAALPDGSIVAAVSSVPAPGGQQGSATPTPSMNGAPAAVSCYYWSPGASAWKLLTPAIAEDAPSLSNVYVSYSSAGLVVTLSIGDNSTSSPLYTIQPFA
ncbi:MAG TPA: sialidase family protein [Ktedonobacterales bacterium]|nr:sialidase family protein [Ktedonobacterales bacterium]